MLNQSDLLKEEIIILLDRVFHAQALTFFGADGGGQHGRSDTPKTCAIHAFDVEVITYCDDVSEVEAVVRLFLDGYRASEFGHAVTDRNLRINLNRLLAIEHIEPESLDWAPIQLQGENFVCLKIDAQRLLQW